MQLKKSDNKIIRTKVIIIFSVILSIVSYVIMRGTYLEKLGVGQEFANIYLNNLKGSLELMFLIIIAIYIYIYMVNRGIKKGIKLFFDKEKKPMPKLLNKSIAFIVSIISGIIIMKIIEGNLQLFLSNTYFDIVDPVFKFDISYYMFRKTLIEKVLYILLVGSIATVVYTVSYYIVVLNRYFDGIELELIKKSPLFKSIYKNVSIISMLIATLILIDNQGMVFGRMFVLSDKVEIIGAGLTEVTVRLWGYVIFAVLIVGCVNRALRKFKQGKTYSVVKSLSIIPAYLMLLFGVMIGFDLMYANVNALDKEDIYISENIKNTRDAYGIDVQETKITNTGNVTSDEVEENVISTSNIPVITEEMVLESLKDSQSNTGYYTYTNTSLALHNIDGKNQLVYITPREISTENRTSNDKTYEFTHGNGVVITSSMESTELGGIVNIQNNLNIGAEENVVDINNQRIYFGLETNNMVIVDYDNMNEYDYTDANGNDVMYTYSGLAGIEVSWLDRLILGITNGELNASVLGNFTSKETIISSRNVLERAKIAIPELMYDEDPYLVISDEGTLVWVIDAYTVSDAYPYSNYVEITYEGRKQEINYIRNSCKVLIDAYDGTVSYYITDRTDPIIMAYAKIYQNIFEYQLPEGIESQLVYPKYLYDIQSEVMKIYHNTKPDVLFREDDRWDFAKYNKGVSSQSIGTYIDSYYAVVNSKNEDKIGLIELYTPNQKSNLISYMVGTVENGKNVLNLYEFDTQKNVVGPMQLEKQIAEDEVISKEIDAINLSGIRVTKELIVIPVNDTLLYVQPVYQTMLNESDNQIPALKKVIIATENKLAIGNTVCEALINLLSTDAIDFKIEDTDDIEGLIEEIIKTNNNLNDSTNVNNWELMGKDIEKLQELITKLEVLQKLEQEELLETNEDMELENTM